MPPFVSRAGQKLEHALATFGLDVSGRICADLGSNAGGFVDCLLQRGAAKVYAIDTGYGALDWKLRKDPRVVVMERTNAMHAVLPERVQVVTIDVAWTKQRHILPPARRVLRRHRDGDGDLHWSRGRAHRVRTQRRAALLQAVEADRSDTVNRGYDAR